MSEFSHVLGSNPQTGAIPQVVVDWLADNLPDSGTSGSLIVRTSSLTTIPAGTGSAMVAGSGSTKTSSRSASRASCTGIVSPK